MIFVGAAIIRREGKTLICQRGKNSSLAYLWEFPGGKQEKNETIEQCVVRECREELDIIIQIEDVFHETVYEYPDSKIHFIFFDSKILDGNLRLKEHNDYKWVLPNELSKYKFCPADIEVVQKIIGNKN